MADEFRWTEASEEAAQLLAAGDLELIQIADKVGVTRWTIWNWRQHPDFIARVEQHLEEIRREIRRHGIAVLEQRVKALGDRWKRLERVIQARAEEHRGIPGGDTGLLVRTVKKIGQGDEAERVEEYAVDTALLKELREHEKQAAQELGQWIERTTVDAAIKSYSVDNPPDDL